MGAYMGQRTEESIKNPEYFKKANDRAMFTLTGAFNIDKVRLLFRTYDNRSEQGSKSTACVTFFLDIPTFELLCHNILSGNLTARLKKDGHVEPIYRGNPNKKTGKIVSRILTFGASEKGTYITVYEGPGKENATKAVQPTYTFKSGYTAKLFTILSNDELKSFALQGKRALDDYYANWFGREAVEEQNAHGGRETSRFAEGPEYGEYPEDLIPG